MVNQDRSTKVLLALLIIGVWGILLRPFFEPQPAHAAKTATIEYAIIGDSNGNELEKGINTNARLGWRAIGLSYGNGQYLALLQK